MYFTSKLAHLHLRVFIWLFCADLLALYNSVGVAALAADDLRHDKLNRFPGPQPH